MATKSVEVQGTLREDGTLVLDEKPNLPPGRVRVTVQPVTPSAALDVIAVLHRIHAEQQARGFVPRSREEIDAEITAMRDEDEERMQELERIQEECWRFREEQSRTEGE